ncbi:MAG TPA: SRPBCC domain-containing protein [Puia sp.]|nr:SRPBCC domain-containing protein [Puia sp.]
MNQPLTVTNAITIQATAARVWDALTNPEMTKKYMFGCEALSDWKPGSPLLWKGNFNGLEMVAVKGKVVKIEPGKLLVYTTIDPNNPAVPDLPENYLTVTYDLSEQNGHTLLTVAQGDYSMVAEGEKRYEETIVGGGWTPILVQIKELLEAK